MVPVNGTTDFLVLQDTRERGQVCR